MSKNTLQQFTEVQVQHASLQANSSLACKLAPYLPYLAVGVGMYWLHNVWVAMVGYHLGMVVMLTHGKQWPRLRRLGMGYSLWQLVLAVLGGVCAGMVFYLCRTWFIPSGNIGGQLARLALTTTSWPFFIGYFVLVNPWLEEFTWRDYLATPTSKPTANDTLFAGYHLLVMAPFVHWPWLLVAFVALSATAWAWRQLARINNGLLIPLAFHASADAGIIIATYLISVR